MLLQSTVCVSCGGWERGLAVETGKSPKPAKCLKNAARTHRPLHTVLGGTSRVTYVERSTWLFSRFRYMCMELKHYLLILHDILQLPLHVLANGCQDYLLSLDIKVLQCGSFG